MPKLIVCLLFLQLYYHNEVVTELGSLYVALLPEEEQSEAEWDLSVLTLKQVGGGKWYTGYISGQNGDRNRAQFQYEDAMLPV